MFAVRVVVVLGARCHSCVVLGIHHHSWVLLLGPCCLLYVVVWDLVRCSCGGGAGRSLCGAGSLSPFIGDGAEPSCMVVWGRLSVVVLGPHCCSSCAWWYGAIHWWWYWAIIAMSGGAGALSPFIHGGVGPRLPFVRGAARSSSPFISDGAGPLCMVVWGPLSVVVLGPHRCSLVEVLGCHRSWCRALVAVCGWWNWVLITVCW